MLEIMSKKVREILEAAKCPECDGSGSYAGYDSHGDVQQVQCRWCFERKEVLNFDNTSTKN